MTSYIDFTDTIYLHYVTVGAARVITANDVIIRRDDVINDQHSRAAHRRLTASGSVRLRLCADDISAAAVDDVFPVPVSVRDDGDGGESDQ